MTVVRQTGTEVACSDRPGERSGDVDGCARQDEEPAPRCLIEIDLLVDDDAIGEFARAEVDVDVEHLVRMAADSLAAEPGLVAAACEASLRIAPDEVVRALNAAYRGQDKPTNVLSFPVANGPVGDPDSAHFLGDIVIAAGVLEREATDRSIPLAHHLQHLVIHGLLHLMGHDHERGPAEADRMEAIEIAALARLAVPNPYEEVLYGE